MFRWDYFVNGYRASIGFEYRLTSRQILGSLEGREKRDNGCARPNMYIINGTGIFINVWSSLNRNSK